MTDVSPNCEVYMRNALTPNVGIEMMLMGRRRVFFTNGFSYRRVAQRLNINYNAVENGYPNSAYNFNERLRFGNSYLDWKWKFGYSMVYNQNSTIDICIGFSFAFPLNGSNTDSFVTANMNDPVNKEPVAYYNSAWGSVDQAGESENNFPSLPLGHFQISYRAIEPSLFNNRSIKFGLEFTTLFGADLPNSADVTFFGPGRQVTNEYKYSDRHYSVGFFMGIEL